jgi:hypothetical protein
VGVDCVDSELSLLCAKTDVGDDVEPSGGLSEER